MYKDPSDTSSNRFKEGLRWAFYEKSKVALNYFLSYYLLKSHYPRLGTVSALLRR